MSIFLALFMTNALTFGDNLVIVWTAVLALSVVGSPHA